MKDIQEKIRKFATEANMKNPPHISALDTMAELGEVAAELVKSSKYGKEDFRKTAQLESELGDVLYSLVTLANSMDIDLDKSLNTVLK